MILKSDYSIKNMCFNFNFIFRRDRIIILIDQRCNLSIQRFIESVYFLQSTYTIYDRIFIEIFCIRIYIIKTITIPQIVFNLIPHFTKWYKFGGFEYSICSFFKYSVTLFIKVRIHLGYSTKEHFSFKANVCLLTYFKVIYIPNIICYISGIFTLFIILIKFLFTFDSFYLVRFKYCIYSLFKCADIIQNILSYICNIRIVTRSVHTNNVKCFLKVRTCDILNSFYSR